MNHVVIGTIKKPHGVKGSVRIKTETDFVEERFKEGASRYLRCNNKLQEVTLETVGNGKDAIVVKFEGVDTYEAADRLRDCKVEIDSEKRPPLEEDAFYFDELTDFEVVFEGQKIGIVKEVLDMPQGAMLRVKRQNEKDVLVPFMKHFVKTVNEDTNTMTLNDIEGLL